jgi:short-subunit dehydrogenase
MARRSLVDSRVLLTGASSGIGWELALALARQKAKLVAVARREERLQKLAAEVRSLGGEVQLLVGDVTDPAIRAAAVNIAQRAYGGLDVLINNAGVGAVGRFDHADEERLRRVMEVDFFAAAELIRVALPLLRHGNRPLVVNVGSILGHRAIPNMSEYCASKFALTALSESLAAEFAHLGIDVLLVSPGRTVSEFQENLLTQRTETQWPGLPRTNTAVVARRIIKAMERGRSRLLPNWSAKFLYFANRAAPGLVDRFFARRG